MYDKFIFQELWNRLLESDKSKILKTQMARRNPIIQMNLSDYANDDADAKDQ